MNVGRDLPPTLFYGQRRGNGFELSPEDTHHAVRVMRHVRGDTIWCIDGSGPLFGVRLEDTGNRVARGTIVSEEPDLNEPPGAITLVCGLTLASRMDWLIEKATELGVTSVHPVRGRRHVGPGRLKRWERIARSASKQCRRGRIPRIHAPEGLEVILGTLEKGPQRLVAEAGGGNLPLDLPSDRGIIVAVGPDIGFSPEDRNLLLEADFRPIDLGSRRLRTETAVLTLLAAVEDRWRPSGETGTPGT